MALGDGETIRFHLTVLTCRDHSRKLMAVLAHMKREGFFEEAVLQGIVVGRGPGSFTGVKIAMMVAGSLSYALHRPVFGYSSLEGLASLVPEEMLLAIQCDRIVPIILHKRNELFWSEFEPAYRRKSLDSLHIGSPTDCLQAIRGKRALVVCPWPEYTKIFEKDGIQVYPPPFSIPDARCLLALHHLRKDLSSEMEKAAGMVPIYGSQVFTG